MNIQSINVAPPSNVTLPRSGIPDGTNAPQTTRSATPSTAQSAPLSPTQLAATATVTQQAVPPAKEAEASRKELDEAVKAVNDFVQVFNNSLQFGVDSDSGKTVVKVIDVDTKEVIKQVPSKEMLAIAKALDGIKGLLVHQKA